MTNFSRTGLRLALGAVGLMAASVALGAEVESKKGPVPIYVDATNKSEVLGELPEGQGLAALERKGMFWQVKTQDGRTGYVSVLKVKHKASASEGGLVGALNGALKKNRGGDAVTESRSRTAVMGVRGLREDDNAAQAGAVRPNLRAVYEMEDFAVGRHKIDDLGEKIAKEVSRKVKDR